MVESVIAYAVHFVFWLIIGLILFCCYGCYRKMRTKPVDYAKGTKEMELPPAPLYEESTYAKMGEIVKIVHNTTDEEIMTKVGVEALLYLKLERLIVVMLNIFAVIGVIVLCPVYYMGSEGDTILEKISIGNIRGDELLGIAPAVILIVFSLIAYYLIYRYI
jgi:uncharacterized membrane protein